MRYLSRILTVVLCCAPAFSLAAGPVATTNGSNLTSYNPSNAYNNQWATLSNGRYDTGNTTAKVDFGNCNAVVLRCAQPKCANGGCVDAAVAGGIVEGCVKSNDKCKQYGDDLINFMTSQLVASSNAKLNEQQMALEQAKIQAEAQAAAANNQSEQLSQMQNQLSQMQQQMAQQQAESDQRLQEALAAQQAQSAAALESMKNAATEAAKENESGITAYQQEAISRGVSQDVIARQQITGQIMTEIEDADLNVKKVLTSMQNAFKYAGCDNHGNNCSTPRRIKKWRELANGFMEPYDAAIDKIYDALVTAQTVGVDLSQIYMMLNNSCNSWGQYICQSGTVVYPDADEGTDVPTVCRTKGTGEAAKTVWDCINETCGTKEGNDSKVCVTNCKNQYGCRDCRLIKILNNAEDVYAGWIDTEETSDDQRTVISCASGVLNSAKLFSRRNRNKNGAGLVDIEELDHWLYQTEPFSKPNTNTCSECMAIPETKRDGSCVMCYCGVDINEKSYLEQAVSKKSVNNIPGVEGLCVKSLKPAEAKKDNEGECTYINHVFGICDTHPYNANKAKVERAGGSGIDTSEQEEMNEIIRLKITVLSQQMYKQYEYLNATLKRLKIQLEKSVLTANLAAAGAKDEDGSASGGGLLGGGGKSASDKEIFLTGAKNCWDETSSKDAYDCILNNLNVIKSNASTNKQKAAKQLAQTADVARARGICEKPTTGAKPPKCDEDCGQYTDKSAPSNTNSITKCVNTLRIAVLQKKEADEREDNRSRGLHLAY